MMPPRGKHRQYTPQKLDEMDARGEIYWSSNGNPRRKVYLDQSAGIPIQDVWLDMRNAHNQNIKIIGYPTEKPSELLQRSIKAFSNPGDLVLDCFSGSRTTLHVASQSGRRWIGIDHSIEAISTTLRRFAEGLNPMGDFVQARQQAIEQTTAQRLPFAVEGDDIPITDFTLFAAEPYADELKDILAERQNRKPEEFILRLRCKVH